MSFESGSVSLRYFYLPKKLPEKVEELFAKQAAPSIDDLVAGEISGWVTGRHMLDNFITNESAYYAGYLRLCLMKAERKINESLLRAECKIQELAEMQASGLAYLKRARVLEIRRNTRERMLPDMPPTLKGIPFIYDSDSNMLLAAAVSDKQAEALTIRFTQTTGIEPIAMTAATAAFKLKNIDTSMLDPVSFTPELEDPLAGNSIGQDFLTWLWFYSEARGGTLTVDGTSYGVMIEGPLTFYLEGDGAHVTVLRNGVPEVAAEAKTALLSGKKLLRSKITIAGNHEVWSTAFDAEAFTFKSLKLPKFIDADIIARFQQRIISLNRFRAVILAFYDQFLSERCDKSAWPAVQKDIHKWTSNRQTKR